MNLEEREALLEECNQISRSINNLRNQPFTPENSKQQAELKARYKEYSDRLLNETVTLGTLELERVVSYRFKNGETLQGKQRSLYYGAEKRSFSVVYEKGTPVAIEGTAISELTHQLGKIRYDLKIVDSFEPSRIRPHAKTPGVRFPELEPINFRKNAEELLRSPEQRPKGTMEKIKDSLLNRGEK